VAQCHLCTENVVRNRSLSHASKIKSYQQIKCTL
jgi:hypothetical protein